MFVGGPFDIDAGKVDPGDLGAALSPRRAKKLRRAAWQQWVTVAGHQVIDVQDEDVDLSGPEAGMQRGRLERVEQLRKQLEKRLAELRELQKMTLENMWETLGYG
eukprot:Skav234082  [mRNA]  locus=scaffold3591:52680:56734:- [translate_table: standard]